MKASSRNKLLGSLMTSPAATAAPPAGGASGSEAAPEVKGAPSPAQNSPPPQRVGAGSVGALKDSLAHLTREGRIIELDARLIDPSPFPDRMEGAESAEALARLAESIRQNGQEVPVLVRTHSTRKDRFQTVYGHRRVQAIRSLGDRKVRAVLRELSDEELLLAQGIENSARQDLSWIEKAMFARRLETFAAANGRDATRLVTEALSIHAPDASRFRTTLELVPEDIVLFIGPAPKVGRTKWLALAEALRAGAHVADRIRRRIAFGEIEARDSDARFAVVLKIASTAARGVAEPPGPGLETLITAPDGRELASLQEFSRGVRISLSDKAFARYLAARIEGLHRAFLSGEDE